MAEVFRRTGRFAGITVAILLAAHVAPAADVAVIVNSGSTNTAGFRIEVKPSGDAELTAVQRRIGQPQDEKPAQTRRNLPDTLVKRLYADLDAAKPLSSLPNQTCVKSASFGTKLTIQLGGQETPDLSCGGNDNAKLQALMRDANEIVKLFNSR